MSIPGVCLHRQRVVVGFVDVQASRFFPPLRTGAAEPRRRREHECPPWAFFENLELASLRDSGLVDVPSDDQFGSRCDQRTQDVVSVAQRPLSGRAPGGRGEVMV